MLIWQSMCIPSFRRCHSSPCCFQWLIIKRWLYRLTTQTAKKSKAKAKPKLTASAHVAIYDYTYTNYQGTSYAAPTTKKVRFPQDIKKIAKRQCAKPTLYPRWSTPKPAKPIPRYLQRFHETMARRNAWDHHKDLFPNSKLSKFFKDPTIKRRNLNIHHLSNHYAFLVAIKQSTTLNVSS